MNQDVKADEVIIANSNSTDKTAEIAQKYPVKLLTGDFKNVIDARDHGFNAASNEIIARFDADTRIPKDWVKRIKADFETHRIDALTGPSDFYDFFAGSAIWYRIFLVMTKWITGYSTMLGTNMALSKRIWETIRDETCKDPTQVHEDMDLAIHIHRHKGTIWYDPLLITHTSSRRERENPLSFFGEYPARLIKMIRNHKK